MGNKVHPTSLRMGIVENWRARWFPAASFRDLLWEDETIRKVVKAKISLAGIASLEIERTANAVKIFIKAARPGLIIGRGGSGISDLTKAIETALLKLYKKEKIPQKKFALSLNIEELKRSEISSANVAQNIAWDLEKRLPSRRVMKKAIENMMQSRDVQGAKVRLSGRIDGAEIARREWLAKGKLPLQTLRANIDYAENTAFTSMGTVGVKVWVYKGEVAKKI